MPRRIRVATMAIKGGGRGSVEANRAMVMETLDQMCAERPDIACLPEAFTTIGMYESLAREGAIRYAETVPGPTTDEAAKRAREHRAYVVCPILRRDGDRPFNSAVILDRNGQVAGIYDKMHPVTTAYRRTARLDGGVIPGSSAPVFELDFGKVGVQICFDAGFPEGWQALADCGAELVFWCSAYDGGFHLRALAFMHQYYIVSAVHEGRAAIIDPLGIVLDRTGWLPWTARSVDLDFRVCHFDWHEKRVRELKKKYGPGITIRTLDDEGLFLVESNLNDVPLSKMLEEFPLESWRDYHRRHLKVYGDIRSGRRDPMEIPKEREVP
ncbi:MAG: carbon-nitrogen hydrolase family protein [Planctomycetota bacterium]|nr:carbon-nitrogen hydrolase family protein [Planctomycetota bacterium]